MRVAILTGAMLLAGCTMDGPATSAGDAARATATATIADADGAAKGDATLSETAKGLRVQARVGGMAQGVYGIHLHMTGLCEAPKFTSAGAHWNPTGKMHGLESPTGHHLGDIPNLTVGADGNGAVDYVINGGALTTLLDADGAAVVVHAKADDYKTDPSGNSGDRIACGVVRAG